MLGSVIAEAIPEQTSFMLFLMSNGEGGNATYVANIERDGAVLMIQEWLERMKTQGFTDTDLDDDCWCCGSKEAARKFTGAKRSVRLCNDCLMTA